VVYQCLSWFFKSFLVYRAFQPSEKDALETSQVAGAIQDYDVGISIMEVDFREHPDRVMYSEYPDALVKRGLAKAVIAKAPDSRGTLSTVGTNIYIYTVYIYILYEKYAAVGFSALSFICVVNCR
jgi:hypothetical protein